MRFFYRLFGSSVLALILLLTFAISMAVATFIENDMGTAAAWQVIYDSWWFELIMFGLALAFITNIYKYRLYRKPKWPVLLFHISFLIIIIGAFITRYHSEGGIMRIRENESSNTIISDKKFLQLHLTEGKEHKGVSKEVNLSNFTDSDLTWSSDFMEKNIKVEFLEYLPDASIEIISDDNKGEPFIEMVVSEGEGRETHILKKGETKLFGDHGHAIGFESDSNDAINIMQNGDEFYIKSPLQLDYFVMASQQPGRILADSTQKISLRTVFRLHNLSFVPLNYHDKGVIDIISNPEKPGDNDPVKDDVLRMKVTVDDESENLDLLYREGFLPTVHTAEFDSLSIDISYGSKAITLPFSIKLEDFQLERYPGSSSPSSYASEVVVKSKTESFPYRIYMNNVLDYSGYRFYQASYDTDEKGTVLSVNKDRPGTMVTYAGYLLMGLGMFWTLFGKGSRYYQLNSKLKNLKADASIIVFLLTLGSVFILPAQNDESNKPMIINEEQAEYFGRLLVQDLDGRIKPVNTLSSEFLRKISRKTYLEIPSGERKIRLNPDQVFISMMMYPSIWQNIPIIKIDGEKLQSVLSEDLLEKERIPFSALIGENGQYILTAKVEQANKKKPANRTEQDKEIIKIDERFNIVFNLISGNYLKIFPNKNDPDKTWYSYNHDFRNFNTEDGAFAKNIIPAYFSDLAEGNLADAIEKIDYIHTYQQVLGDGYIPDYKHVNAEILYNKVNLNFWLFQACFTIGIVMLVLAILKIFKNGKVLSIVWNSMIVISLITFLLFTANLVLRWYVSGHPPWSNGYEMLVFVSWVLLLCGFIVHKKSDFTLPLTMLFTGALLFVSYLDWINPEITNLMPVLKSYWLKVHVATIVSSYAPLALSALIGAMVIILILIKNNGNSEAIDLRIKELSYINEISMTIGLFVLTVGTFLGGVWANESWGRYWAWDPKETWALISIIVYAIVLHLRFIPKLNNMVVLNIASMFAFWSIIMTSFGVNYYLSGLHSYAAGDPMPIPNFVYVTAILMIGLSVMAVVKVKVIERT
ncbi:cytochrome c biogenesis protein CcsA [Marinigracilibium pacificum]|uniref:Cytochrome c biogenesis protein CcsA n=1 Tax=Marinigracilibium pacificum TaxID=2729599 RepID=A0A848J8J1_9BACT|nr:cytochrome c biogenesis protein CcsA [Marinigracilibium pacificum]NMM50744.1 cytochrome c biogenesis protein CcsA [Marinigracilibium pacificum]